MEKIILTVFTDPMMGLSYESEPIMERLEKDLAYTQSLGIHTLPAYMFQYGDKAVLMQSFEYQDFAAIISELTNPV